MIQGSPRLQTTRQHAIHQIGIELQTLFIDSAGRIGNHTWPGDGKAISIQAHLLGDIEILLPTMIMIAGDPCIAAISYSARLLGKVIPNRWYTPRLTRGAFNLK